MSLRLILGVGLLLLAALAGGAVSRSVTALARDQMPRIGMLRTVVVGGLVTAAVCVIGNRMLSLYLARGSVASAYGAAGALVAILLLGAEFTEFDARRNGDRFVPDARAVPRHG